MAISKKSLKEQCELFASGRSGCEPCKEDKFDLTCTSDIGIAKSTFTTVLDPCNKDIKVSVAASIFGGDEEKFEYKWDEANKESTIGGFAFTNNGITVEPSLVVNADLTATSLDITTSLNVCLSLKSDELSKDLKTVVEGTRTFCSFSSDDSALCNLVNGEKACGAQLSELLESSLVQDVLKSLLGTNSEVGDMEAITIPIPINKQNVQYTCEDELENSAAATGNSFPMLYVAVMAVIAWLA